MTTFIKIAQLGTTEVNAALKERGWEDSRDYLESAQGEMDYASTKIAGNYVDDPDTKKVTDKCYIALDMEVEPIEQDENNAIEVVTVDVANNIREFYWATEVKAYRFSTVDGLWITDDAHQSTF